jgi:hypothetical protein
VASATPRPAQKNQFALGGACPAERLTSISITIDCCAFNKEARMPASGLRQQTWLKEQEHEEE